jgi:hypothetical protein
MISFLLPPYDLFSLNELLSIIISYFLYTSFNFSWPIFFCYFSRILPVNLFLSLFLYIHA